ncbi:MAG: hypothetical protein JO038_05070 [Alphaproteobacteria bacterium]|nr:hypothetical protein [Alphaproteobacteria bacterium]
MSVSQALRAHGRSWLLWVEPGAEVGRVDVLADGLIRGTIDRLTVEPNGWDLSLAGRLAVLSKAWRMVGPLLPDDAAELE